MYNYFDVDDILANEETTPVVFATSVFEVGKELFAKGSDGELLAEATTGARAAVPLWAATPLRQKGFVNVGAGQTFAASSFREFKADPLAPNLHVKCPYYYEVGLKVASMLPLQEGQRLREGVTGVYQRRYQNILTASAKKGFDLEDARDALCERERRLLDAVRQATVKQ